MTILDQIVKDKKAEIALKKSTVPLRQLEQSALFERDTFSLKDRLAQSNSGIIAEHKRRSPSKSVINHSLSVQDVASGYENAQVSGMSVLTDGKYFGGSLDDLIIARASCNLPLLRKDFTIDPYQIIEAKAYGADVILLIASILSKSEIKQYSALAKDLKLEVLLEVHNEEELNKSLVETVDMIGVNNRNLKTFEVDLNISKSLSDKIPDHYLKVSESGISSVDAIKVLQNYGFQGFLIGENFMKTNHPGKSATQFINDIEG